MKNIFSYSDLFILKYGKGRQKKWVKEKTIIKALYDTTDEALSYLKINNIELLGKYDSKDNNILRYSFGYLSQIPKTQIDLCVNAATGKMFLEKIGTGYNPDLVEEQIYKFIEKQIKQKNIYFRTNINYEEFLIS